MINQSTYSFIMSKLEDFKMIAYPGSETSIQEACEQYIRISYTFIKRHYAENLTDASLKNFVRDFQRVLFNLQQEYRQALDSNSKGTQSKAPEEKSNSIDMNLLCKQQLSAFRRAVENLLIANLTLNENTKPEPKAI